MITKTKILLVEDNQNLSENVKEMLIIQGYEVCGILDKAEEACTKIEAVLPDLILMDIQLKGKKNGIDLAEELRQTIDVPIVFLTSSSGKDIVKKVNHIRPDGFITKPFTSESIITSIELALQTFRQSNEKASKMIGSPDKLDSEIFIRENGWLKKIMVNDIEWIKADGSYTHIYVMGRQYTLRNTVKEVILKLPENQFVRIHKSYIVNMKKVDALSSSAVKIEETEIPVGRNYYHKLLQKINKLSN